MLSHSLSPLSCSLSSDTCFVLAPSLTVSLYRYTYITCHHVCHPSPLPSPSLLTPIFLFLQATPSEVYVYSDSRLETHSRNCVAPLGASACPPSVTTLVTSSATTSRHTRSLLPRNIVRDRQTSEVRLPTHHSHLHHHPHPPSLSLKAFA